MIHNILINIIRFSLSLMIIKNLHLNHLFILLAVPITSYFVLIKYIHHTEFLML